MTKCGWRASRIGILFMLLTREETAVTRGTASTRRADLRRVSWRRYTAQCFPHASTVLIRPGVPPLSLLVASEDLVVEAGRYVVFLAAAEVEVGVRIVNRQVDSGHAS